MAVTTWWVRAITDARISAAIRNADKACASQDRAELGYPPSCTHKGPALLQSWERPPLCKWRDGGRKFPTYSESTSARRAAHSKEQRAARGRDASGLPVLPCSQSKPRSGFRCQVRGRNPMSGPGLAAAACGGHASVRRAVAAVQVPTTTSLIR